MRFRRSSAIQFDSPTFAFLIAVLSGAVFCYVLVACEKQADETVPEDPAAVSPGPATGTLDNIVPVTGMQLTVALSKLGRSLDSHYAQGGRSLIVVAFAVDQREMRSDAGKTYPITAEEWKGMITMNPDGRIPVRSLPVGAHSHNDGLGRLARNAWICTVEDNLTLRCEHARAASGYSQ